VPEPLGDPGRDVTDPFHRLPGPKSFCSYQAANSGTSRVDGAPGSRAAGEPHRDGLDIGCGPRGSRREARAGSAGAITWPRVVASSRLSFRTNVDSLT